MSIVTGARGALNHLTLSVSDLAACEAAFYTPVLTELGYEKVEEHPGEFTVWWHGAGRCAISLSQATTETDGAFDRYRPGFHHMAWWAADRADVDAFHAKLVGWGVTVLDAPADYPQYGPGYYAVFFADPDGMKFELTWQEIPA